MRLLGIFLLAAAAAETRIPKADLATAAALRDQALQGSRAFAIAESLVREVGHRLAGSENDARGVAWALRTLSELGFDRVWTEPVEYPVWTREHEEANVLSPESFPLAIAALGGSVPTPPEGLAGEVVAFPDFAALRAAEPGSLAGKIAYVARRMERARDGSGYGPVVAARVTGASVAAEKGAIAFLMRSAGTRDSERPHTGNLRYGEGVTRIPAAALANAHADRLEALLARGPVAVQLRIAARERGLHQGANVIGELTGRERPDELVALGAHLDSWDLGEGALDDAAGVGIVLAAARLIAEQPKRPRRSIRVVLFAAEEIGLYGARAYAERHREAVARHVLVGESDFGGGRIYQLDAAVKPEARAAVLAMQGVLAPLGIALGRDDAGGGPDFGPLRRLGAAAVDLRQDGTYYFDYHHTVDDTLDKLVPADLDQNVAAWAALAWMAANAEVDFGSGSLPERPGQGMLQEAPPARP
jgi:Zn-dependent M28 family amino/carboxypeptidase